MLPERPVNGPLITTPPSASHHTRMFLSSLAALQFPSGENPTQHTFSPKNRSHEWWYSLPVHSLLHQIHSLMLCNLHLQNRWCSLFLPPIDRNLILHWLHPIRAHLTTTQTQCSFFKRKRYRIRIAININFLNECRIRVFSDVLDTRYSFHAPCSVDDNLSHVNQHSWDCSSGP